MYIVYACVKLYILVGFNKLIKKAQTGLFLQDTHTHLTEWQKRDNKA